MAEQNRHDESRRRFVKGLITAPVVLATPALLGLAGCDAASGSTDLAEPLVPTPACEDDDEEDPTPAQTEGPYFTRNSPERRSLLESRMQGTPLVVSGLVLTRSCQPVPNALLDFWQADAAGAYDNVGYRLRGHQFTDARGIYQLETIVPGLYPGRTRHIHVKVQAPNQPVLTTQLYFPGESHNASDRIFRQVLLMEVTQSELGQDARFNFVLNLP